MGSGDQVAVLVMVLATGGRSAAEPLVIDPPAAPVGSPISGIVLAVASAAETPAFSAASRAASSAAMSAAAWVTGRASRLATRRTRAGGQRVGRAGPRRDRRC